MKYLPPAIVAVTVAAVIAVQIRLSRLPNGKLGLILPLAFILTSVALTVSRLLAPLSADTGSALVFLLLTNIPTVILLAIYAYCRTKKA
jgi:hypothetical protein